MHAYIYARRRRNLAILRIMTMNFFGFSNAAFIFFPFSHLLDFTFSQLLYFTFSHLLYSTFSHLLYILHCYIFTSLHLYIFTFSHHLHFWTFVFFIFNFWVSFSELSFRCGKQKVFTSLPPTPRLVYFLKLFLDCLTLWQ